MVPAFLLPNFARLLGAMEVLKILEAEGKSTVAWKWKKKLGGSLLACCFVC